VIKSRTGITYLQRSLLICLCLILTTLSAFAFDPTGTYSYAEKGFSGSMTVSWEGTFPKILKIEGSTVSMPAGNMCDDLSATENGAGRIASQASIETSFASEEGNTKFGVKFLPNSAIISVEDKRDSCGIAGEFGGKWVKQKPPAKKK
jgi:hypothetical protein